MKLIYYLFVLLLLSSFVHAVNTKETLDINLLSVSINGNESFGNVAKLYLYVEPGNGNVFIQSYPLSKIDTQLSTRLGNEIACSLSSVDCDKYDFFYTIRVDSSIVSGPSAGGAITLLTLSALEDVKLYDNFAMTGMITSGGVITPVDSIKEKVEAASKKLDFVIIPQFALNEPIYEIDANESTENLTLDSLSKYDIQVIPVKNIWEALSYTSDYELKAKEEIIIPESYTHIMSITNEKLCNRTINLFNDLNQSQRNDSLYIQAQEYYNLSLNETENENYYSSASYCYSANMRLRNLQFQNLSQNVLLKNYQNLKESYDEFYFKINDYEMKTFSDLETYMIVMERLIETNDVLTEINQTNISSTELAFAVERFYSAVAWSSFYGQEGVPLVIDQENLQSACLNEIAKVDMIKNYLALFLPEDLLKEISDSINHAQEFSIQGNYPMCLYSASKAKVNGDFILTSLNYYDNETTVALIDEKLNSARDIILKQHSFPIMGYSYIQYSNSLLEKEPQSSLLFSEYAITFSDLSRYFPKKKSFDINFNISSSLSIFIYGFICGFIFFILFFKNKNKKKMTKRKKK